MQANSNQNNAWPGVMSFDSALRFGIGLATPVRIYPPGRIVSNGRAGYTRVVTRTRRSGFSMVEVMMSMGILTLLITLTVAYYGDMRSDTQVHAARAELDQIRNEIQRYQMEHRSDYPLGTIPQDGEGQQRKDPWGQPYLIDPARHLLWSCGPNG